MICFLVVAMLSAALGLWLSAFAALLLGVLYAVSGHYLIGRRWREETPKPRARPVKRRRR
jgi:uncharacterized iron-regulated membrane protein